MVFDTNRGGSDAAGRRGCAHRWQCPASRRRRSQQLVAGQQCIMSTQLRRCIKPNPAGLPGRWDAGMVLEQLRAGGVLEAVRIACAGDPSRL